MKLLEGKTALITGASRGIGKAVALAFAKQGANIAFTANAVAPGFIITDMTAQLPEDVRKEWAAKIPLRRGGTPEDIADVCTFLASDMSRYVTGQVIHVCGGMNM